MRTLLFTVRWTRVNMERWQRKQKLCPLKMIWGDIEKLLAGFTKNRNNIKKAKEKPKAGPKGNVKKMAEGGKTGMRGQVKKDDMNKKAVNSAVKEAMDSKYEGKINPPKEPDGGVAKKCQECLARLDLIVRKWHITAVALLLKVVQLVRCLWAAKLVVWALLPRVAHSLRTGN
jgi:hypothetical protein